MTKASAFPSLIVSTVCTLGLMTSVVQAQLPSALTNGLVAYYKFDGNFNDSSGSGSYFTNISLITAAVDRFGNDSSSIRLDSLLSRAETSTQLPLSGNIDRTISLWVRIPVSQFGGTGLVSYGVSSVGGYGEAQSIILNSYNPESIPNTPNFQSWGNYASSQTAEIPSFFDTWRQLTYVYDGVVTTSRFYLDGTLIQSFALNDNLTNQLSTILSPLYLGQANDFNAT